MFEERQVERKVADDVIGAVFDLFRNRAGDLDEWESSDLAHAIGAHFRGAYGLAAVAAELSITPQDQRSQRWPGSKRGEYQLEQLERAYAYALAEPVRIHPQFGPIVLKKDAA